MGFFFLIFYYYYYFFLLLFFVILMCAYLAEVSKAVKLIARTVKRGYRRPPSNNNRNDESRSPIPTRPVRPRTHIVVYARRRYEYIIR